MGPFSFGWAVFCNLAVTSPVERGSETGRETPLSPVSPVGNLNTGRLGSGDVPMQHSIRQQLKLNEDQLREAMSCGLTREGYVDILREKGLL